MTDTTKLRFFIRLLFIQTLLVAALCVPAVSAQSPAQTSADEEAAGTEDVNEPKFKDYKGVKIGMSADEAREKLGKPDATGDGQDSFLISDNEIAQIFYDKDGKVNAVAITYMGKNDAAPTALAVLGEEVPAEANGRVYKLVRYPKVGYWVAYDRSGGDSPMISVTIKKMRVVKK